MADRNGLEAVKALLLAPLDQVHDGADDEHYGQHRAQEHGDLPATGSKRQHQQASVTHQGQKPEDADYSILEEICYELIKRARTGDIGACRLLFDRISGSPVSFVMPMGQEEEVPTEIGIS